MKRFLREALWLLFLSGVLFAAVFALLALGSDESANFIYRNF